MAKYKYETHLHTSETSLCSNSSGKDFADYYKSLGYAGIFVTDHFLNGNTAVSVNLPWHQRIDLFCRGYEETAKQGEKIGLDVFFGWEYSYGWAHLLTYGLDKNWLVAHPEVVNWNIIEYFDRVHDDGGYIVHAHPFREGVDMVQLFPGKTDAVEIINASRIDEANKHAQDFANSFGILQTAGSDIHSIRQKRLCGIAVSKPLTGGRDYINALKSGDAHIFDETRI